MKNYQTEKQNYIDEKGNYHNVEKLTLAQIYKRGIEDAAKPTYWKFIFPTGPNFPECKSCGKIGGASNEKQSITWASPFCPNCGRKMLNGNDARGIRWGIEDYPLTNETI